MEGSLGWIYPCDSLGYITGILSQREDEIIKGLSTNRKKSTGLIQGAPTLRGLAKDGELTKEPDREAKKKQQPRFLFFKYLKSNNVKYSQ